MGALYDWFIAADDSDAAEAISGVGNRPALEDIGIDPVVQGATLEELLTGRSYDDIEEDPRCGHPVAIEPHGIPMVLTVTDGLIDALAKATHGELETVAIPWAATEEFWGAVDPKLLADHLKRLGFLARTARERGWSMYCWVCT